MFDSGKKIALKKKSYEVSYALFRVAAKMGEQGIAEALKSKAVQVLEMVVEGCFEEAEKPLEALDYLIKFAMDLNAIGFVNGEILIKEMGDLKLMVAECVRDENEAADIPGLFPEVQVENRPVTSPSRSVFEPDSKEIIAPQDISSHNFFSEEGIAVSRAEEYQTKIRLKNRDSSEMDSPRGSASVALKTPTSENDQPGNSSMGGFLKSGMRQIAILDKIRQSGNCRLRDIQEILPDSSERTIRYDLESLIERRLIERVGNGGPSLFYRMRQN